MGTPPPTADVNRPAPNLEGMREELEAEAAREEAERARRAGNDNSVDVTRDAPPTSRTPKQSDAKD